MAIGKLNIRVGADIAPMQKQLKKAERSLASSGRRFAGIGNELSMTVSLPILGVGAAAIKAAGDMQMLERALEVQLAGSGRTAAEELENLREVAKNPGLGFEQAVKGSVRLQAVGFDADMSRRALAAFGNALAVAGGDANQLDGVSLALTQIASKGKVSAEEINQLAERVPQIRSAMKAAFGTADTEVIQGLQKAGLSVDDFVLGVVSELEKIPQAEGGINNSLNNMQTAIKVNLAKIGTAIDQSIDIEGVFDRITDSIVGAVEWFSNLDDSTRKMIVRGALFIAAIGPIAKIIGSVQLAASAFTGVLFSLNKVTKVVTLTQKALNFVLTANPIGIVITAVGLLIGGLAVLYKKNQKVRAALNGLAAIAKTAFTIIKEAVGAFVEGFEHLKEGEFRKAWSSFGEGFTKSNPVGIALTEGHRFGEAYRDAVAETMAEVEEDEVEMTPDVTFPPHQVDAAALAAQARVQGLMDQNPVVMEVMKGVKSDMANAENKGEVFSNFDVASAQAGILQNAIEKLLDEGVSPTSAAVQGLIHQFRELRGAGTNTVTDILPTLNLLPDAIERTTDAIPELSTRVAEGSSVLSEMAAKLEHTAMMSEALGGQFDATPEKISIIQEAINGLIEDGFSPLSTTVMGLQAELDKLLLYEGIGSLFTKMAGAMQSAAKSGASSLKELGAAALNAAKDVVRAMIIEGVTAQVSKILSSVPPPFSFALAAAAGAAAGALFNGVVNKFSKPPAFADGGIVSGPTFGLFGEYAGARNNPEVVAPLDKLEKITGNNMGAIDIQGTFRGQGDELLWVIERAQNKRKRVDGF